MVTRRTILVTTASTGIATALAGCSGGNSDSDSSPDEETTESTPKTEEDEQSDGFADFTLEDLSFTYGFSDGLSATAVVRNQHEDGSGVKSVNISMVAYDGDTRLGEDDQWQDINAELTSEFGLTIASISDLSDVTLEDVTEVRVRGKQQGFQYATLETVSGDTVRTRVEN